MDKKLLQSDIGLVACMCGYMGDHMKLGPDEIASDEAIHMVDMYGALAEALSKLDDAINALPD